MLRPALFSPPMAVLLMAALLLTLLGGCNLPYTLMGFTTPDVRAAFDGEPIDLCAGVPVLFEGIEISYADQPRALQSGDIVVAK